MGARSSYMTRTRRERERFYRRRMVVGFLVAVGLHALAVPLVRPLSRHMPLVRHIGYYGPTQIMPEISVERELGEVEREAMRARGGGAEDVFRVIQIAVSDWPVPEGRTRRASPGEVEDDVSDEDEDLLRQLEASLPQPTSRDMVVTRVVKPEYPPESRAAGCEGVVVFRLHVTRSGDVANVWLLRSEVDQACETAARRALYQWKYRPFVVDGRPVDFLGDQPVRFRLYDPGSVGGGDVRTHGGPSRAP